LESASDVVRRGRLRAGRSLRAALSLSLSLGACSIKIEEPQSIPSIDVLQLAQFTDFDQEYGVALARADLDGDGRDELLVGSPSTDPAYSGLVLIVSLDGFQVLGALFPWSSDPDAHHDQFGRSLLVADFDGNGVPDVVVGDPGSDEAGAPGAGEAWYYPGPVDAASYVRLHAADPVAGAGFGSTLACGDFDGDGFPDAAIGATGGGDDDGSCVTVCFGPDLLHCETRGSGDEGAPFAVALAALPAPAGSSAQPLLVGAPRALDGELELGSAVAWDIEGGAVRLGPSDKRDAGFGSAFEFGNFSAPGARQLAVLAPDGSGALYLYDAANVGAPRRIALPAPFVARAGAPVKCCADVSRDGADELVLLSASVADPAGVVFSPGHGAASLRLDFAAADALIGDFDGDGIAEVLLSTPTALNEKGGYALLRLLDFGWQKNQTSTQVIAPPLPVAGAASRPAPYSAR
jgi:hypothetical protein